MRGSAFMIGLATLLALASCGGPEPSRAQLQLLDRARFDARIEPILEARCANPSCHGRPERGLSLYAPLRFRADPARTHLPEPLDERELRHNFVAACVFAAPEGPEAGAPLSEKPLGGDGALYHGGGGIFDGRTDDDYRAIVAWIVGREP